MSVVPRHPSVAFEQRSSGGTDARVVGPVLSVLIGSRAPGGAGCHLDAVRNRQQWHRAGRRSRSELYDYLARKSWGWSRKISHTTAAQGSTELEKATTLRPTSSSTVAMNFSRVAT